jgi:hypothetical protein
MTDFLKGREAKILVRFYDVEDRVGGHHLILINDVVIARVAFWIAEELAQKYRSIELVCTVPVTRVGEREFGVDMREEATASLCRFHARYPDASAEHWLPCAA